MMTTKTLRSDEQILDDIAADRDQPTGPAIDGGPLRAIADAARRREAADADVTAGVHAAREAGLSWAVIGAVLGVSRQAMMQRYGS